ncbi:MAG: MBL fold metallo-hydrolase [Verrucomicrobia bacterium]|nr:MBL fold metallo-hydrolase [Verrucomicrobiota bacterium]
MISRFAAILGLFLFQGISPAQTPASASAPMVVVFLGTGGPRPAGRAASCNLVIIHGRPRLLVDSGSGAFTRLGELGIGLRDLDIILLTHLHIDHTADVPSIVKARAMTQEDPVHFLMTGPAGKGDYPSTTRFAELLFGQGGAWTYVKTFGARVTLEVKDLPIDLATGPTQILQTPDGIKILTVATHHGDAPAVAYRIEYGDKSVTFSGDIDPLGLENLTKLATGTDLLVFNCAVLDPPGSPAELYTRHSPPKRIGEVAKACGARHLILTHIPPLVDKARAKVSASIRAADQETVQFAEDKMRVSVQ